MKNVYVNSRLHPLLIGAGNGAPEKNWLFSQGEPWLLVTPARFARLAVTLGVKDARVGRLLRLLRRHSPDPGAFFRRIGLPGPERLRPEEYPPALCPRCDGVHYPHPDDADGACPDCLRRAEAREARRPGGGALGDRQADARARLRLRGNAPGAFDGDVLSPNHRFNKNRVLVRDWDAAVNRVLMGGSYRKVAREFDCSVGLLHKKVVERRHWEDN